MLKRVPLLNGIFEVIGITVILFALSFVTWASGIRSVLGLSRTQTVTTVTELQSDFTISLNTSIWAILVALCFSSLTGLWIFSSYLEFDIHFCVFALRLVLFLFSVWLTIDSYRPFALLLSWEIVGLISFLLISHWSQRSLTLASAYTAIGFNRVGDVLLLVAIIFLTFTAFSALTLSTWLLVLALTFKSVITLNFLWLPEAMEGPTPVSSLLHSCTLVMAGIFSLFNFGLSVSQFTLPLFLISLIYVIFLAGIEKDFKRTIAFSTVIMVGFIWIVLLTGFSCTAALVCILHAAYKSALFVAAGKLLAASAIYTDDLALPSVEKSILVLVALFLLGHRSSAYALAKHNIDATFWNSSLSLGMAILVSTGLFLTWLQGLQIIGNWRRKKHGFSLDILGWAMLFSLFTFSIGLFNGSVDAVSSVMAVFVGAASQWFIRSTCNFGSVSFSTSILQIPLAKYGLVRELFMLTSVKVMNFSSVLLVGLILSILTGKSHKT